MFIKLLQQREQRARMRERTLDLAADILQQRTARRQREAKAALVQRGVEPRVAIGSIFVPPHLARHFSHCNVGAGDDATRNSVIAIQRARAPQ